jgi:uncharacterized protein YecE (DUF72 family)
MHLPKKFYSGLSGLQLPISKAHFPPAYQDSSRLSYYASIFNSIEFNSSFYKVPLPTTVSKWSSSVPAPFKFTFKLWKQITHTRGLVFQIEDLSLFFKALAGASENIGCVLLQFPPSLTQVNEGQLDMLLSQISELNKTQRWKIALEFRNKSWYTESVYRLLHQYKAAIVIHDKPNSATPKLEHSTDFIYLRFHGPTGNYRGTYT